MHNIKSIILQSTSYLKAKKKNLKIKSSEVYLTEKATLEIGSGREGTYRTKEVPKTYTAAPPPFSAARSTGMIALLPGRHPSVVLHQWTLLMPQLCSGS